jgi:hypothetical protein
MGKAYSQTSPILFCPGPTLLFLRIIMMSFTGHGRPLRTNRIKNLEAWVKWGRTCSPVELDSLLQRSNPKINDDTVLFLFLITDRHRDRVGFAKPVYISEYGCLMYKGRT